MQKSLLSRFQAEKEVGSRWQVISVVGEKAHIREVRELASNPTLPTDWSRSESGMVLNLYKSTQLIVRRSKPGMHEELHNW